MDYNLEEIIQALKAARRHQRLSQRALSKKTGIPQSHISNIERGAVDIQLSTLIDLARALDLEVTLVPRKLIPAVQSITRIAYPRAPSIQRPAYSLEDDDDA
ncbi:MAG: helix-turn-helix transcriptional regulator [Gammaproteobacteria bacterium]|nr:helix-turn-helix transcriptional regulator [Gammaproteobacteria bacterium]